MYTCFACAAVTSICCRSAAEVQQGCIPACRALSAFVGSLYLDKQTMGCSTKPFSVTDHQGSNVLLSRIASRSS